MFKTYITYITFLIISLFFFTSYAEDNKNLSYIYSEKSINFVSGTQVNAIEFSVPIAQVNSPPGQFSKGSRSISYVNNNKIMLFYLSDEVSDVQFMVALINGRVLSLHFKKDKLQGRVVHIPESMSELSVKKNKTFDLKIKNIMQSAFYDINFGEEWIRTKEVSGGRHKSISIKKYTEWDNYYYKIRKWHFCSNSKNILLVDFNGDFNKNRVLALTLSKKRLLPHECSKLIILYAKSNHSAV